MTRRDFQVFRFSLGGWVCVPKNQSLIGFWQPNAVNLATKGDRPEFGIKGKTPFEALYRCKKLIEGNKQ
jgi:hypothetical protein